MNDSIFDWGSAVVCSQGCAYIPAEAISELPFLLTTSDRRGSATSDRRAQSLKKVVAYKAGRAELLARIVLFGTPTQRAELPSKKLSVHLESTNPIEALTKFAIVAA